MDSDRWLRIEQLCHAALECEATRRAAYLQAECGGDQSLLREVESLLAHQQHAGRFMETPALQLAAESLAAGSELNESPDPFLGRRLGPYRIVERIGSGGMGEVYRAVRADEEFSQQVAIKLVRSGQDPDSVYVRFKNERQILASLDHPNIAKLLDGGTTEEGVPYVVMELVEGQRIDVYANSHKLSIADRLKLFAQVCSAVQYAHQRLIVHRDIKPGNILVTSGGVPKLLDFGIAKILDESVLAGKVENTLTIMKVLTPGYASPEQVRGEPVTTASDVYSLGVVLYELLTGRSPYRIAGSTPDQIARAVCDTEPERPSTVVRRTGTQGSDPEQGARDDGASSPEKLSKRLSGDLDNIVLMALRKEPDRRYASVEQLSQDLRRHLENLPVIARRDTLGYRASKFVVRHKVGVAAVAIVAATLVTGMAVTLHEARVAREQAEIAHAQRQRAERRFNDVRRLANSLLFDLHDSISTLPGATPARQLLVGKAIEYLDSLAKEANGDPSLQRELAAAYTRLGDIQGDQFGPNVGKRIDALESYRKAAALREAVVRATPNDPAVQNELGTSYDVLAVHLMEVDPSAAADYDQKSMKLATDLVAAYPANVEFLRSLSACYKRQGMFRTERNDLVGAVESNRTYLKLCEREAELDPGSESNKCLSNAHKRLGALLTQMDRLDEGLAEYRASLALDEALLKLHPDDVNAQYALTFTYSDMGFIYSKHGDLARALANYRKVLAMREAMAAADPNDHRAPAGVANTCGYIGLILLEQNHLQGALVYHRRALAIRQQLGLQDSDLSVAQSLDYIGDDYLALAEKTKEPGQQRIFYRQAKTYLRRALPAYLEEQAHGRLVGGQVGEPRRIAQAIARCDAALARMSASRQP